jgi:hypothetical protein
MPPESAPVLDFGLFVLDISLRTAAFKNNCFSDDTDQNATRVPR